MTRREQLRTLSVAQARRIALAAQGFGRPQPASVTTRHLTATIARLNLLQIDSVNVFERSHYLPLYSRLGAYDKNVLDRLAFANAERYVEYWAHEASLVPVADRSLFQWRMDAARAKSLSSADSWASVNAPMLDWLRIELGERGPIAARDIEHDANVRRGPWWGWSDVKRGLEVLFRWGEVVSVGRNRFERRYALATDVLDPALREPAPRVEAHRELVRRSLRAHGIGTLADIADYYRLASAETAVALRELEDEGEIERVAVRGWSRNEQPLPVWLHREARVPRHIHHDAIVSPFDPIVWYRDRALRLFDFYYRIEIYTPAPQRVYGYYVLPVLLGDQLAARVDLKSDRQARVLRVQAAWREADAPPDAAERVASLLVAAAEWQGLSAVEVMPRGDLTAELSVAVQRAHA